MIPSRLKRSCKADTVLFRRFSVHSFSLDERDLESLILGLSVEGQSMVEASYPFAVPSDVSWIDCGGNSARAHLHDAADNSVGAVASKNSNLLSIIM